MAKNKLLIGTKNFKTKKEALEYYKIILNFYIPMQELNDNDFEDIKNLYLYDKKLEDMQIKKIIVDNHTKYKNVKCFYLIFNDDVKEIFSYRLAINGCLSKEQLFSNACRESISIRLKGLKRKIFKNRPVKCAISTRELEWEEAHIDHKNPLTFSVIVKAFIAVNNIDINTVEYINNNGLIFFKDNNLAISFDEFHKKMAVLRIISKEENLKRSGNSRVKPTSKDFLL